MVSQSLRGSHGERIRIDSLLADFLNLPLCQYQSEGLLLTVKGEHQHAEETALLRKRREKQMWRELAPYRRPKRRPLAAMLVVLAATGLLFGPVAGSGGHEVTVAVSEKVPKHLCKRALDNLEVKTYWILKK